MKTNKTHGITFRPIAHSDIPFLYTVYRSTRIEELSQAHFSKEELEDFLKMQFSLQHQQYMDHYPNATFEVIINDSTPIGRLYMNESEDDMRIMDIALLPEFRNRGIGSTIMHHIIQTSEKLKKSVSLHVEYNNPALRLYEKLGFKIYTKGSVYILMKREADFDNDLIPSLNL